MNTSEKAVATIPQAGSIMRREFGSEQTQAVAETASSAVAAREQAAIQARCIMAERHPRNIEQARVDLLHECERTGFASCARYRKPLGWHQNDSGQWEQRHAEGWSIRFAEAALRCMTNIYPDSCIVYEGDDLRIMRFSITDLESNLTYANEVSIRKTTEKKSLRKGQIAIAERTNSYGDKVYVVEATDDELQMKQNSAWSKFIRNGLRFVPSYVLDECERRVKETLAKQDSADPDAAKRRVIDAFAEQGVGPVDLQAFLGKPLDRLQPAEMKRLREIYTAIKDGETTWSEIMEEAAAQGSVSQADDVAERKIAELKKRAAASPEPPAPPKKEKIEQFLDKALASNRASAAPVPEVEELPDPLSVPLTPLLYCGGVLYEKNDPENPTAWRKMNPQPETEKKADDPPAAATSKPKLQFGKGARS